MSPLIHPAARRGSLLMGTALASLVLSGCGIVDAFSGDDPSEPPTVARPTASVATTDGPASPPTPNEPTQAPDAPATSPIEATGPSTSDPEMNLSAPDVGPDFDQEVTALLAAFTDAYLDSSYDDKPGDRLEATQRLLGRNHTIDLSIFNLTPAQRDDYRKSRAVVDANLVAVELRLLARNMAIIEMDVETTYTRNGKVVSEDHQEYEATVARGNTGEWLVQDLSRPHSHDGD